MSESRGHESERGVASPPFDPPWFARGGHVQTLLGFYHRRNLTWTLRSEDLVVESEPGMSPRRTIR